MSARGQRGRRYHQNLGLVFLLVTVLFLVTTIGAYRKAFTSFVPVTLVTDHIGSQMREGADVKVRGVLVGEVRDIRVSGERATMRLGLKPDRVERIPAGVTARLLPKTLFGSRYVALQVPDNPGEGHLSAGAVIGEDRSAAAIEIEQVLGDLMPILQAVQPQKVSATLNAVSQALEGRGERLGDTLVRIDSYLQRFKPSLPELRSVIGRLDDVADTYADTAPELMKAVSDLTVTTRTIAEQRADIRRMVGSLTSASTNTTRFLRANADNLINLVDTSRDTVELLGEYAPQYPCMLEQFAYSIPIARRTFGEGDENPQVQKVTIVLAEGHHKKYKPGRDTPEYNDQRGPRCYGFREWPQTFPQHPPGGPLADGTDDPGYDGSGKSVTVPVPGNAGTGGAGSGNPAGTSPQRASGGSPTVVNSRAEQNLLSVLLAPSMGVSPDEVPQWSSLLVGPLFRGAEVRLR